jgi:hypothetical protein
MDPLVAQPVLFTSHRIRAKGVFVPTHALERTVDEQIALDRTGDKMATFHSTLE